MESVTTHIQPLELKSAVQWNRPQLLSSRWNSNQLCDGIRCNLYPAAETEVSSRIELAATLIQPPELESGATLIQVPELESVVG